MLPKQIDPLQLADNEITLKGDLSLSEMVRLQEFLCENSDIAKIHLEFGRDAQGIAYMRGNIKAEFSVLCQRCNTPMTLSFDIKVNASPVRSDSEAQNLPKHYDPLLLTQDPMVLSAIVEEEILLSIPIVPRHPLKECPVQLSALIESDDEENDLENPFKTLKKLLRE